MDSSLTNAELSESIVKVDSVHGSEKSDSLDEDLETFELSSDSNGKIESTMGKRQPPLDLPETCTVLVDAKTGAHVYLVGTAHFSQESKDDVEHVIRLIQPNVVVIELCDARRGVLAMDEETVLKEAANVTMDMIINTIQKHGVYYGLTYLLLLNLSAQITKQIGMAPGGEFRVAVREAAQIPNCLLILGDRSIKTTLLRALSRLSWYQSCKLIIHLLFSNEEISLEEVEKCKRRDMLEQFLVTMSGEYPGLSEVFVDERDIILTHALQQAARTDPKSLGVNIPLKIVGVVGIGHAMGITRLFPKDQSAFVDDVLIVPPPKLSSKIAKVVFKITVFSFGGYLVYRYFPLPQAVRSTASGTVSKLIEIINKR